MYVSSCTARVGAAVCSIASEKNVVAPAAQVSFGWKHEYPEDSYGHTTNRTKVDLSVDAEKFLVLAKRGAIGLSRPIHPENILSYQTVLSPNIASSLSKILCRAQGGTKMKKTPL